MITFEGSRTMGDSEYLAWAADQGKTKDLISALAAGTDPNAPGAPNEKTSPLHYAARNGDDEAIQILLAAGAKADARGRRGKTPLHAAAAANRAAACALLLDAARGKIRVQRSPREDSRQSGREDDSRRSRPRRGLARMTKKIRRAKSPRLRPIALRKRET